MQKTANLTLLGAICCRIWVFFVIFGCKILVFKNPASVKEMTNMRYGYDLTEVQVKVENWYMCVDAVKSYMTSFMCNMLLDYKRDLSNSWNAFDDLWQQMGVYLTSTDHIFTGTGHSITHTLIIWILADHRSIEFVRVLEIYFPYSLQVTVSGWNGDICDIFLRRPLDVTITIFTQITSSRPTSKFPLHVSWEPLMPPSSKYSIVTSTLWPYVVYPLSINCTPDPPHKFSRAGPNRLSKGYYQGTCS